MYIDKYIKSKYMYTHIYTCICICIGAYISIYRYIHISLELTGGKELWDPDPENMGNLGRV